MADDNGARERSPIWLMIRAITVPTLIEKIFEKATKDYKVDWSKIEQKNLDIRADQILEEALKLQAKYPYCYLDFYSSLRIISIAAQSKRVQKLTLRLTEIPPARSPFYADMFNLPGGGDHLSEPANRAAWFCMMDKQELDKEWLQIVDMAMSEEQQNTSWTYYAIKPPTITSPEDIEDSLEVFKQEFGKTMEDSKKLDFPVEAHPFPSTGKYIRYAITVPKDPSKTYLQNKKTVTVGLDPTMFTFYLDHFFAENTIRVAWPVVCEERIVADNFAKHVLGSEVVDEPTLYYTDPLKSYTSSEASEEMMVVSEEEKARIDEIFISSVDFTYAETEHEARVRRNQRKNKKRRKKSDPPDRPAFRCYNYKGPHIWNYLNEHFDPKKYKPEWRDVLSIVFTVRLRKVVKLEQQTIYDSCHSREFKIICKPDKLTYSPKLHEIIEPEYRATLRYIAEQKLKLIGKPLNEHIQDAQAGGTDGSIL